MTVYLARFAVAPEPGTVLGVFSSIEGAAAAIAASHDAVKGRRPFQREWLVPYPELPGTLIARTSVDVWSIEPREVEP